MIRQAVLWIVCKEGEMVPSLYGKQLVSLK
jgi:hypothetical protein